MKKIRVLIVESPVDAPNKKLYFTVLFPEERRLKNSQYFHFCAMLFKTLDPDASSQADKKCQLKHSNDNELFMAKPEKKHNGLHASVENW